MTIIVGRATSRPRRALFYLASEGRNVARRVLDVRGLVLDRVRFTSHNKDEQRAEATLVANQVELAIELVPANRKARRKAEALQRKVVKKETGVRAKKARNTWYSASLNPPAGIEPTEEDFQRGRFFLEDTAFRRYAGKKRGPVQAPQMSILLEHTNPADIRADKHAHYGAGLFTAAGTVIPIYYDAINTAIAGARWAADRGWPATCSYYTRAVEQRVRLHYPEAHAVVIQAMIRRAEEGIRIGAITIEEYEKAKKPEALAALIEQRFRPRRDDADLEERISLYRLLDEVPASQTETVLAEAGYRIALGDGKTKRGTQVYLVQPIELDDNGSPRKAISLHRIARAGLQAEWVYDRLGDRMGSWIDARVAGLHLHSIHEVRRDLDPAAAANAARRRRAGPGAAEITKPSEAHLAEMRAGAIRITVPSLREVKPHRIGRIEVSGEGFVLLPRGAATDHPSLQSSDATEHLALARLILERRADDSSIEISGPREGAFRVQNTVVALAARGVDPARFPQLSRWPDLAAVAGLRFSETGVAEASRIRAEPPQNQAPAPKLPTFRLPHLVALESDVRRMAEAGTLPGPHETLAKTLTADWAVVRRAHPDPDVEAGRRAIREGVGITLVALLRDAAASAPLNAPVRVVVEDALDEVSSSARATRARFDADAISTYLGARLGGLTVEDACRAAGPVERERADARLMADALRIASRKASAQAEPADLVPAALRRLLTVDPPASDHNPPPPSDPEIAVPAGESATNLPSPSEPTLQPTSKEAERTESQGAFADRLRELLNLTAGLPSTEGAPPPAETQPSADATVMAPAEPPAAALLIMPAPPLDPSNEPTSPVTGDPTTPKPAGEDASHTPLVGKPAPSEPATPLQMAKTAPVETTDIPTPATPATTAQPTAEQRDPSPATTSTVGLRAQPPDPSARTLTDAERAATVLALNQREAAAEGCMKSQPSSRAFRLRPDIAVEERQIARRKLVATALKHEKGLPRLRAVVRYTEAAAKKSKCSYDRASFETGLTTAREAYRIVIAGERRPAIERRIRLDDAIRLLADRAKDVRLAAAQLAVEMPTIRRRVSDLAAEREASEDAIAIEARLAVRRTRENSKPTDQAARDLETALVVLERTVVDAEAQGRTLGGFDPAQKIALAGIAKETTDATAWVPPLGDDPRTIRARASATLDHKRLPVSLQAYKAGIKRQIKATNEIVELQNSRRAAAKRRADAARQSTGANQTDTRQPQKAPRRPNPVGPDGR